MSNNNAQADANNIPWYLYIIQAFAAWLAALFVLLFVAIAVEFDFDSPSLMLLVGGSLLVIAGFLQRQTDQVFASHVALAFLLSAQLIILTSLWQWFETKPMLTWAVWALLQTALLFIFNDKLTRLLISLFLIHAVVANAMIYGLAALAPWLLLAFCSWAYTHVTTHPKLNKVLPALAVAGLLILLFESSLLMKLGGLAFYWYPEPRFEFAAFNWLADVVFGIWSVAFICLLFTAKRLERECMAKVLAGIVLCIIFALYYFLPEAVFALAVLLLGFARASKTLQAIAIAALLFFVSQYYYYLPETLLGKSLALMQMAAVFLVLYALLTLLAKRRGLYEKA